MRTIIENFSNEIVIQKSRFIGLLRPIKNSDEVKDILMSIKKEYPKATHYCYGYIVNGMQKSNDDGEPSSTAGKPILETLLKNNLTDVLLVVVRYFGGIKLGAGGLTRAYVDASNQVIKKSRLFELVKTDIYRINISYNLHDIFKRYLIENNINILETSYLEDVEFVISSTNLNIDELKQYMQDKINIVFIKNDMVLIPCN